LEEGGGIMSSPWRRYKRYSDNVKLEARLIEVDGRKLMEVREPRGETIVCPSCSFVISQQGGLDMPNNIMDPQTFHSRHRPLDKD
jgi:hypothetical protein